MQDTNSSRSNSAVAQTLNGTYGNDARTDDQARYGVYAPELRQAMPGFEFLPVPWGKKFPPPTGFTKRTSPPPTQQQYAIWERDYADYGCLMRLARGAVGIDCDNYADPKTGRLAGAAWATLDRIAEQAGVPWPRTLSVRSRADGSAKGIYWLPEADADGNPLTYDEYGVLNSHKLYGDLGPQSGVDILRRGHRYVHLGYNPAAGCIEQWVYGGTVRRLPDAALIAVLPTALFSPLCAAYGQQRSVGGTGAPVDPAAELAAYPDVPMCADMRALVAAWADTLRLSHQPPHTSMLHAVRALLMQANFAWGNEGLPAALRALRTAYTDLYPEWQKPSKANDFDRTVNDCVAYRAAYEKVDR